MKGVIPADERTVGDLLQTRDAGFGAALEPAGLRAAAPCGEWNDARNDCGGRQCRGQHCRRL